MLMYLTAVVMCLAMFSDLLYISEPAVELTPEEQEMMNVMGFAAFNTTKVSWTYQSGFDCLLLPPLVFYL